MCVYPFDLLVAMVHEKYTPFVNARHATQPQFQKIEYHFLSAFLTLSLVRALARSFDFHVHSIFFFLHFGLYQIRIRIESKSVTWKIEYTVCYAHTVDAYTNNPANVAYISVCICFNTQMSYWALGIDFFFFSLLNIHLAIPPFCAMSFHFSTCARVTTVSIHNCIYLMNEVTIIIQSRQKFHKDNGLAAWKCISEVNIYEFRITYEQMCAQKQIYRHTTWILNVHVVVVVIA